MKFLIAIAATSLGVIDIFFFFNSFRVKGLLAFCRSEPCIPIVVCLNLAGASLSLGRILGPFPVEPIKERPTGIVLNAFRMKFWSWFKDSTFTSGKLSV